MREERLDNARHGNNTSHDRTKRGVELEESHTVLSLGHADGCELVFEEHAGRNACEVGGGGIDELSVFCHTILVGRGDCSLKRNRLHGDEFQEVGNMIEI